MRCDTSRAIWRDFALIGQGELPIGEVARGDTCIVLKEASYDTVKSSDVKDWDTLVITPTGLIGWMGDTTQEVIVEVKFILAGLENCPKNNTCETTRKM